jgi:hypothetical protein
MKPIHYICLIPLLLSFTGCKKSQIGPVEATANINLINAIASPNSEVKVNFTGKEGHFGGIPQISFYNTVGLYSNGVSSYAVLADNEISLKVVRWPDSTAIVFSQAVKLKTGSSHSLFMMGTNENISGMLVEDNIPVRTKGTSGIRFINLSPDSAPISINLEGQPLGSIEASLPYKSLSEFKTFNVKPEDQYFVFEIHDAESGDLLTSYFYDNLARMKNETMIIRGLRNGGDGPGFEVTRMRH